MASDTALTETVPVRFSAADKVLLLKAARESHLKTSAFVRLVVLQALGFQVYQDRDHGKLWFSAPAKKMKR